VAFVSGRLWYEQGSETRDRELWRRGSRKQKGTSPVIFSLCTLCQQQQGDCQWPSKGVLGLYADSTHMGENPGASEYPLCAYALYKNVYVNTFTD
jgi:hypothetical protein